MSRRPTLVATSLGYGVIQLDVSVVNVAVKPIGADLGARVSDLQWIVSAYTIAFAALILTAGAVADRVGARRVLAAGFGLFTLASAACGAAPTLAVLVAARAVQGIGAAILAPTSLAVLNHAFPEAGERARAVGLWAAGASAALAAGPLVGGVLTEALGWRAIFFINAPIGAAGIFLTLRFAGETTRSPERGLDLPGALTATLALGALAAATIAGGDLAGYAVALASAAAFVGLERRRAEPMLPLRLFRSPTFSAMTAVGLLVNVAFYGLIFVFSLVFQRAQGMSPLEAGLAFAPCTVAILVANLVAGRHAIPAGAALMAAAAVALLVVGGAYAWLLVPLGFGLGLVVPGMTAALLGSVEPSRSGVASGALNSARQTGSVIGVALFGALLGGGLEAGLHRALLIATGLAVAVAVVAAAHDTFRRWCPTPPPRASSPSATR